MNRHRAGKPVRKQACSNYRSNIGYISWSPANDGCFGARTPNGLFRSHQARHYGRFDVPDLISCRIRKCEATGQTRLDRTAGRRSCYCVAGLRRMVVRGTLSPQQRQCPRTIWHHSPPATLEGD